MNRAERRHVQPRQGHQLPGAMMGGVPLIEQRPQQQPDINIRIVPHDGPCDDPIEFEIPSQDEKGNILVIKHVFGGKSKKLAIAAVIFDARGLDIADAEEIEKRCNLSLTVAGTLERLERKQAIEEFNRQRLATPTVSAEEAAVGATAPLDS